MAIVEITKDSIRKIEQTSFESLGIIERADLQRLLRDQIDVICPDTLVIAEEFGEWQDAKRRVDLLCVDKDGNLVIVELKRTEDGGHMDLQAIRYAAMISKMTFEQAVKVYEDYLARRTIQRDARASLTEFLDWNGEKSNEFAQDVRIVLVSAEFSKEITTAVMWLNEYDLDIRCVRIKPYKDANRVFADVQQVIPLPEAEAYQVQIKEKERSERNERSGRHLLRFEFSKQLLAVALKKTDLHANVTPSQWGYLIKRVAGVRGLYYAYVLKEHETRLELGIDCGDAQENRLLFDHFFQNKDAIEKDFGGGLDWDRLDEKRICRICFSMHSGGYKDDPAKWAAIQNEMVDAMIRFVHALKMVVEKLG